MTVIDTYALQIVRDDDWTPPTTLDTRYLNVLPALEEAAENLTDLLPDGVSVRITHWTEDNDER